ncbi:MAG: 4-vinyl reductase [Candidatus Nanoarchaeia archaeon]|jgi:predicted hydrocarbon binding protein
MNLDFVEKVISLDFFLDASTAVLKNSFNKFKNSRIMRVETFSLSQEILEKYTGKAALLLFFNYGEMSAELMAKEKKIKNNNYVEIIKEFTEFAEQRKWIKIKNLKLSEDSAILTCEWTLQSKNHSIKKYCVCSFIEGFIKKILSYSEDKRFLCNEVKCLARGDDCCEFRIKKQN